MTSWASRKTIVSYGAPTWATAHGVRRGYGLVSWLGLGDFHGSELPFVFRNWLETRHGTRPLGGDMTWNQRGMTQLVHANDHRRLSS